jgi:hypothetical protein
LKNHFTFWLFLWSNLLIKYHGLREEDFKIHSIDKNYDLEEIWEDINYSVPELLTNGRNRDHIKVLEQTKRTKEALQRLKQTVGSSYSLSDFHQ